MSLSLSTGYAPSDMCNIITDNISTKKKKNISTILSSTQGINNNFDFCNNNK